MLFKNQPPTCVICAAYVLSCLFLLTSAATAVPDGCWNNKPWDKEDLQQALKKKDPEALAEWAYWSRNSWGGAKPDPDTIFKYARESAEAQNSYGQAILSRCYLIGEGVKKNPAKGLELARLSSEAGHPLGIKNLANCHADGSGSLDVDIKMYQKLTKESAAKGCLHALQNQMKAIYFGNHGIERDREEGIRRAVHLCLNTNARYAAHMVLRAHRDSPDHPLLDDRVIAKACERINIAIDSGNSESMATLGGYYCRNGRSNEGVPLILKAAQTPQPNTLSYAFNLSIGGSLSLNAGSIGEYSTCFRLARDAYSAGNQHSTFVRWAADSYLYEWPGHPPQPEKALPYVKILVARGSFHAHEQLGRIYYCVKKSKIYDKRRGVAHLEYSSDFNSQSLHLLGDAYIIGPKEDRDYVKGYAVTTLMSKKGNKVSRSNTQRKRELARKELTPSQLKQAEELIKQHYPTAQNFREKAFETLKEYGDLPENTQFRKSP